MPELKVEDLNLTDDQKAGVKNLSEEQELQIQKDAESWDVVEKPKEEAEEGSEKKEEVVEDGKEKVVKEESEDNGELSEEEIAQEEERITKRAEELKLTVDEVKQQELKEAEELQAEQERIAKLSEESGKTPEEIVKEETEQAEKAEQERIEAIAKQEGLTVEAVLENERKDTDIVKNHKGDAKKVARALRMQQSEYSKAKNELDKLKAQEEIRSKVIAEQDFENKCENERARIIKAFSDKNPEVVENLSEDAIFEKGKALLKKGWEDAVSQEKQQLVEKANAKKQEMLSGLDEESKAEFGEQVKSTFDELTPQEILNPSLSADGIVMVLRGKKYSPSYIKELEEKAYNRGLEQKKILGIRTSPKKASTDSSSSKAKVVHTTLTDTEKKRALEMMPDSNMSEAEKYKWYEEEMKGNDF